VIAVQTDVASDKLGWLSASRRLNTETT
jgi:hypothetical protein